MTEASLEQAPCLG
uniref:Uncharacterized protein n=1 Tax=Arundo donax TaxID=35708 RepID=A0A0A9G4R7_ARUDO